MKAYKLLSKIDHSRTYKLLYMKCISRKEGLCTLCSPHKGCNGGRGRNRNWKKFRKKQWKIKKK